MTQFLLYRLFQRLRIYRGQFGLAVLAVFCHQGLAIGTTQGEWGAGAVDADPLTSRMQAHRNETSQTAAKAGDVISGRHKLDRNLANLLTTVTSPAASYAQASPISPATTSRLTRGNPFIRTQAGNIVQVVVQVENIDPDSLAMLEQAGLSREIVNESLYKVQGWIPAARLQQLTELANVIRVTVPQYGAINRGAATTQGDAILLANQLRAKGFTGKGMRVGIISDGANDWTASRASGDLPAAGITRYGNCTKQEANLSQCVGGLSCNEGTAMAEIIYDIAPDARLAVASASTSMEFIQRVNQLTNEFKADVIVDDLGFFGEPYFQDGEVASAVAAVTDKVVYVSSAGNNGDGHYERDYSPAINTTLHDFGRAEGSTSNQSMGVIVGARSNFLLFLQWNDAFNASGNDYDLGFFDAQNNLITGSFDAQSGAGSSPFEALCLYNSSFSDELGRIVINKKSGAGKRLEMFNLSARAQQYSQSLGGVFGHAAVPSVLAVGAINASDSGHDNIAFYSSRGPSRIDFPSIEYRNKPDIVAIDGVSVTGTGGFPSTFFGTSASAPHVAAIAAQLMSALPGSHPNAVRRALTDSADDLGTVGFDFVYGHGRVNALTSLDLLRHGLAFLPAVFLLLQ